MCKIHDLLRDLCLREAIHNEKFLCVLKKHNLDNLQGISTQRRIIVPRSTLKKKYLPQLLNGLQSAPLARSFICDFEGNLPWHTCRLMRHTCRLMRVLKMADKYLRSRKERNYKYSLEDIFQLVNSRYLAVNANLNLNSAFPSSMYLLWNLQTLIVKGTGRRQAIGLFESWKMPQLRHVEFVKLYLPDPPSGQESGEDNFVLRNLQTLLNIGDFKCDEEVVKRIPNVNKLKISYEGFDGGAQFSLNNRGRLNKLESLA